MTTFFSPKMMRVLDNTKDNMFEHWGIGDSLACTSLIAGLGAIGLGIGFGGCAGIAGACVVALAILYLFIFFTYEFISEWNNESTDTENQTDPFYAL